MGGCLSDSDESSVCVIESLTQGAILGCERGYAFAEGCGFGDRGGETGGELVVIGMGGRRGGGCVMIG